MFCACSMNTHTPYNSQNHTFCLHVIPNFTRECPLGFDLHYWGSQGAKIECCLWSSSQHAVLLTHIMQGRAKVAIVQDDLKETEARLEALLSFDGRNHWALAEQGWLVFKKGNIQNAVCLLEQAVEVCGDNSTYRRRLVCFAVSMIFSQSFGI